METIIQTAKKEVRSHFNYIDTFDWHDTSQKDHFSIMFAARNREAGFIKGSEQFLPLLRKCLSVMYREECPEKRKVFTEINNLLTINGIINNNV